MKLQFIENNCPPSTSEEFKNPLKTVIIKNGHITLEYPQTNAIVEKFNRSLNKFENQNLKNELSKFLHLSRNTEHSTIYHCRP